MHVGFTHAKLQCVCVHHSKGTVCNRSSHCLFLGLVNNNNEMLLQEMSYRHFRISIHSFLIWEIRLFTLRYRHSDCGLCESSHWVCRGWSSGRWSPADRAKRNDKKQNYPLMNTWPLHVQIHSKLMVMTIGAFILHMRLYVICLGGERGMVLILGDVTLSERCAALWK